MINTLVFVESEKEGKGIMRQLLLRPEVQSYDTFKEFAAEFKLGSEDLILTNEYIYNPYMKDLNLGCRVIFQEKYGAGEPTDVMVDQILAEANKEPYDRIIGIGGGSIIDISKVLRLTGSDHIDGYYDKYFAQEPLVSGHELIIIPTTCGTGSEVTSISITNRTQTTKTKLGLVSPTLFPDFAVLIPEVLNTLPYEVFATSSIDALIHAVESYLSPNATPFSEIFSEAAMKELVEGYCRIINNGKDARFKDNAMYLRASTNAGIAFGNAGCAGVHGMSFALGGKYHVPHGESCYQFFTDVLRKYQEKKPDGKIQKFNDLCYTIMKENGFAPAKTETNGIVLLDELLSNVLEKKRMREYGAIQEDVMAFAESTVANQQRLLKNNYVPFSLEEIAEIYQARL